MIKFLTKGLLRDRSRSLFPVLVITLTVAMVVFAIGFMRGTMNSLFLDTAVVFSGHEKIVTRAYNEESQLLPNDLALLEVDQLVDELGRDYPNFFWTPRITFAGLLDVPDENGETKSQGPVITLGIDLFSEDSRQAEIWELDRVLVEGHIPQNRDDALISTKLADQLDLAVGETVTFIGSTMDNAFTTYNFNVSGTFNLRKGQTDKQMMLVDLSGARLALDMDNAASAIFGFTHSLYYDDETAVALRTDYNKIKSDSLDIFSPFMLALRDGNQMGTMVDISGAMMAIMGGIFLVIVMIVLWNMGLMNGLRRYGEIGLRLAMGESKGQVYRSMISEAVIIGLTGTVVGTGIGLAITYYVQENGIDYTKGIEALSNSSMVMPNIFYAQVTPDLFYIGFIPGVLATVLGTMLAGMAIYKREMAQLFKELET
ncbi:MAG TPA: ABC transporter permease [Candidatus Marinimicrobia bacterium]|jgi:putative ABC transport system permease protein|nr:ABC transporter permease [Candidatus Neomarinimicrobiota bacterium]